MRASQPVSFGFLEKTENQMLFEMTDAYWFNERESQTNARLDRIFSNKLGFGFSASSRSGK